MRRIVANFRDPELSRRCIIKCSNGGEPSKINDCLNKLFTHNRNIKGEIWVWVDKDIYQRKPERVDELHRLLEKRDCSFKVLYNTQNYEDYVSLHFASEAAHEWSNICDKMNHFSQPRGGEYHLCLFKRWIENCASNYIENCEPIRYAKGDSSFLDRIGLKNAIDNLRMNSGTNSILQSSDMSEIILEMIGGDFDE